MSQRGKATSEKVTHGRHCSCSACARQDWAEPGLASCGMHGPSCPPRYAPLRVGVGYYATTPGGLQVWVPLYGWDGRG